MPQLITPCGGGGGGTDQNILVGYFTQAKPGIPSGVPVVGDNDGGVTTDAAGVAFVQDGLSPQKLNLVSVLYYYTLTLITDWVAFAGNRTVSLTVGPGAIMTDRPMALTSADNVQVLTISFFMGNEPAAVTITYAQASGSTQAFHDSWLYVQATQWNFST